MLTVRPETWFTVHMANIYDYESNPQPGDMPYDQAEQAADQAVYDNLSRLYDVCVVNSWCKRDRNHAGDCAEARS